MTPLVRSLAALLWLAPVGAGSEPITVTFSGTITEIPAPVDDGTFVLGAPVSGSFEIDPHTVDSEPGPDEGYYDGAVSGWTLEFGSYPASASTGLLFVRNGMTPSADSFYVEVSPTGGDVAGFPLFRSILNLFDTSLAALSSDEIPTSLDLADFDHATVSLEYQDGVFSYAVYAEITSLAYTPAPEPGAVLSMAAGMLALGLARLGRAARVHPDPRESADPAPRSSLHAEAPRKISLS